MTRMKPIRIIPGEEHDYWLLGKDGPRVVQEVIHGKEWVLVARRKGQSVVVLDGIAVGADGDILRNPVTNALIMRSVTITSNDSDVVVEYRPIKLAKGHWQPAKLAVVKEEKDDGGTNQD